LRDLWLGRAESADWKEINDRLTALSFWRRLLLRLRRRGQAAGPREDQT